MGMGPFIQQHLADDRFFMDLCEGRTEDIAWHEQVE